MNEVIGIITGHDEEIHPYNEDYSYFFDMLRLYEWRSEILDTSVNYENLQRYSNLFIGEAHDKFTPDEISSLQNWIQNGGNLLITSSMSGDIAPSGKRYTSTNMKQLLYGKINFEDVALGVDRGVRSGKPFDTKVEVDITELIGVPATLCYDTGCVLTFNNVNTSKLEFYLQPPDTSSTVEGVRLTNNTVEASNPYPSNSFGYLLFKIKIGKGSFTVLGSSFCFKNDTIIRNNNVLFMNWLLMKAFPVLAGNYIDRSIEKPQRHRLLHGYPFPNLMQNITEQTNVPAILNGISSDENKPIIIGILPHTFCNPQVKGCGFCTFPHESYRKSDVETTVKNVSNEISSFTQKFDVNIKSQLTSIYIGGGTANLTPLPLFADLCKTLNANFNTTDSEVTLEGVPKYFSIKDYEYFSVLKDNFNNDKIRISMGIQTFDAELLQKMGRQHFGDKQSIIEVAKVASNNRIRVSGDLLFNLPNQTIAEMREDINVLIESGFEQISLYHLVMFRHLGTEWSKDRLIIDALPDNQQALENWLELRQLLMENGYRQTTLTNFEKSSGENNFQYENCVFQPEEYNWIGFGPSAISVFYDDNFDRAVKLINPESASEYNQRIANGSYVWNRFFTFDVFDMKVLYITRKIASLKLNKLSYYNLFGTNIEKDFKEEIDSLLEYGFIESLENEIYITPKGMFYADTIAGLFALRKIKYFRMLNVVKDVLPDREKYYYSEYRDSPILFRMG